MVYAKSMPRLRFQRAPAQKREGLLDSATSEFAAHGYEDASINRILLAAGFSKGSFYYYFDDKADLAAAVLERWAQRYEKVFDDVPTPNTPEEFWAASHAAMERSTTQLREEPHVTADAMMRLGTALSRLPEVRDRVIGSVATSIMTKVVAIWTRGQQVGAIRTDLSVGDLLSLVQDVKLTLVRLLLPSDRAPTVDEVEAFTRIHFDLVRRVSERR
jgi:AcrR family transcriptional regulator